MPNPLFDPPMSPIPVADCVPRTHEATDKQLSDVVAAAAVIGAAMTAVMNAMRRWLFTT
jgi:hypothetical protein